MKWNHIDPILPGVSGPKDAPESRAAWMGRDISTFANYDRLAFAKVGPRLNYASEELELWMPTQLTNARGRTHHR